MENYWIVKARPSENDLESWLRPGGKGQWRTARMPKDCAVGDRLIFWSGSPVLKVVGLGEVLRIADQLNEYGDIMFSVRYLTSMLPRPVSMADLRSDLFVRDASFLKSGPAGTLFRLSNEQGRRIYELVCRYNHEARSVWNNDGPSPLADLNVPDIDIPDMVAKEGRRTLIRHLRIERSRQLVETKRKRVLKDKGCLACEVCGFDFEKSYGDLGRGFCEVHHLRPLAEANAGGTTTLGDLAVVCSNCHRMLHKSAKPLSIKALGRRLTRRTSSSIPLR